MEEIAVAAVIAATSLVGLVMFWLTLRFLWRVYEKGGVSDLVEAASALALARGIKPNGARYSNNDSNCTHTPRPTLGEELPPIPDRPFADGCDGTTMTGN